MGNHTKIAPTKQAGYLENRKGYYLYGFSTRISPATDLEIKRTPTYAIQLVSSFSKIALPFLYLVEHEVRSTVSSQTTVYYIYCGKSVLGKVYITVQRLADAHQSIWIVYRYKDTGKAYKRFMGISKPSLSIKGKNVSKSHKTAIQWKSNHLLQRQKED